jgi:hypothetical protein
MRLSQAFRANLYTACCVLFFFTGLVVFSLVVVVIS